MRQAYSCIRTGRTRRLLALARWILRMEDKIPEKSKVDIIGEFKPSPFRNNGFVKGIKPEDLAIK